MQVRGTANRLAVSAGRRQWEEVLNCCSSAHLLVNGKVLVSPYRAYRGKVRHYEYNICNVYKISSLPRIRSPAGYVLGTKNTTRLLKACALRPHRPCCLCAADASVGLHAAAARRAAAARSPAARGPVRARTGSAEARNGQGNYSLNGQGD